MEVGLNPLPPLIHPHVALIGSGVIVLIRVQLVIIRG
jgi:hypothetical protein